MLNRKSTNTFITIKTNTLRSQPNWLHKHTQYFASIGTHPLILYDTKHVIIQRYDAAELAAQADTQADTYGDALRSYKTTESTRSQYPENTLQYHFGALRMHESPNRIPTSPALN